MSKNRKGMHKEWHTKRIDDCIDVVLQLLDFLEQTYNLEKAFGLEVAEAYHQLVDALYNKRGELKVEVLCGQYLVEYGYDWVPDTDTLTVDETNRKDLEDD